MIWPSGYGGDVVKGVQFKSNITTGKQGSGATFPNTAVSKGTDGTLEARVTFRGGQIGCALRQGVQLHGACEICFFCGKLLT